MTTRYQDLDIQNIVLPQLQPSSYIPTMRNSWISSSRANSRLLIQTPEIITETYGIPPKGIFYATDKSRAFYKLPLCHDRHKYGSEVDYDQIKEFQDKIIMLDSYFGSGNFKGKFLGDRKALHYEYQPILRISPPGNDIDNNAYKPPYIKLKIDIDHKTGQPTCRVFDKSNGVRDEIKPKNLDDLTNHMKFMSKHRFIIHVCKLFTMKKFTDKEKRIYGICLKLAAVECTNKCPKYKDLDLIDPFD